MSDSNAPEHLEAKHEQNRERRIEGVKRWVEYIKSEPPERWGPQQNAVVDGQLDAAESVHASASHRQRVERVADEIMEIRDGASGDSENA